MILAGPALLTPAGAGPGSAAADEAVMGHALALARRGLGRTWPNPSVGAVLVQETPAGPVPVARARTADRGRPHAERVAIEAAGPHARGATLYVTLEPCSHHGHTPPCADAVIEAGIARVVSAMPDPDERVAGRGHARLRSAGIRVDVGVGEGGACEVNAGHVSRVAHGRPHVQLKLARTGDGYAAGQGGARLAITGEMAGRLVHLARARTDAIMVGAGTARADDPLLTCRLPGLEAQSPVRVLLDTDLRLSPALALVRTAPAVPTWIVAAPDAPAERAAPLAAAGARLLRAARGTDGRLDLAMVLRLLAREGITRLFSEGGPQLAGALAAADLIDELLLLTARHNLAAPGRPALDGPLHAALRDPSRFRLAETLPLGDDRMDRWTRAA